MLFGRPVVYALAGLLLAALVWGGWQWRQATSERSAHAETRAKNAETLAHLAELTAKAAQAVRSRETRIRGMLDASNTAREQGIAHAVESQQNLVADLRAGNQRLRKQWAGCQASPGVPGDAASESGADEAADLRAVDTGNLVRAGDDADLQVAGLQAYARACQALTRDEE